MVERRESVRIGLHGTREELRRLGVLLTLLLHDAQVEEGPGVRLDRQGLRQDERRFVRAPEIMQE